MPVELKRLLAFRRAADLLPGQDLYWAGCATLVARRDELAVYDRVYAEFFGHRGAPVALTLPLRRRSRSAGIAADGSESQAGTPAPAAAGTSAIEVLRRKNFAACTPAELEEIARLMLRLRFAAPFRRSRRRRRARRGSPDLRRTLRAALRTGGEPVELRRRERRLRRRRLVLLVDVSGSMTPYARVLVDLAYAAVRADRRFEAFAFGTRLTRLTRALDTARPDDARRRAAELATDWEGGTRIGGALKTFLDRFGHAGLARGAVVVICSDGLDVGDPELVAAQMARLHRLAHRVVWLNPLKASPDYEPLARGMAAALPWVDVFASGHSLEDLEETSVLVASLTRR